MAETVSAVPGLVDACLKLFDRLHASYKKHKQLPQSIESIQRDLRAIKEAIGRRSATVDQEGIQSRVADLEEIRQKIEDSVDLYNFKASYGKNAGLEGLVTIAYNELAGHRKKLLQDIEEIKQLLTDANLRAERYRLSHAEQASETTVRNEEEAYCNHPKEANPVGLETPIAELVQMMSGCERKLMVLAIYGPGGSGKTILAEAVYNKVRLEQEFECKAWVSAARNVKILLRDILDELGFPKPPPSKNLSQHLRDLLQKKRYIIGIDGLDTIGYWNDVLHACPDDNMCSIIILTTTKEEIARSCQKNCPVYRMQPLDSRSALALLLRKAFHQGGCPSDLCNDLTVILETCEYLPLAIANTGDHIRSVRGWNKDMCVSDNIGALLVNKRDGAFQGMQYVLNRSYTSLSDNARTFLLSLNTFPKDHVIKRKSLIRRLLAESLITCAYNETVEDLADKCFTSLIEHNFILPMTVSITGQMKTFRVHRMMLQFIKAKAISENFVTWLDIHQGNNVEPQLSNIRRLYLHNTSINSPTIAYNQIDLSRVRLLTFHGNASKALMHYFKDSTFLRVLVLENNDSLTDDIFYTICIPPMLKYLSIRGSQNVSKIPKNILNLPLLETLDTRDTKVNIMPMDVIQLPNLLHLFGQFQITCKRNILEKLSPKLSQRREEIFSLQTLAGFFIDESPGFVKIMPRISKLSKVKILCRNAALSDESKNCLLSSLNECFGRGISQPNLPLQSLSIDFGNVCSLDFLYNLDVPSPCFLRSLKLCGKLGILPTFIKSDMLEELCLSGSNIGANVLVELKGLQNLKFLKVTEDPFTFQGEDFVWHSGWFVNLKRLCLVVRKLPKIIIQEKAMEGLKSLQLYCSEWSGITGIKNLLRLEELVLTSNVSGAEVDDLLQQVSMHPMRPTFLRPPVDADGLGSSSRRMLHRVQG